MNNYFFSSDFKHYLGARIFATQRNNGIILSLQRLHYREKGGNVFLTMSNAVCVCAREEWAYCWKQKEKKRCHYIRMERMRFLSNTPNVLWLVALCRCHAQSNLPPTA